MGNFIMYAIFDNIEKFNTWHYALKLKLNYPIIGVNASTGLPDEENLTTEYTNPLTNPNDSRIVAWVGEETHNLVLIEKSNYLEWFEVSNITIPTDGNVLGNSPTV